MAKVISAFVFQDCSPYQIKKKPNNQRHGVFFHEEMEKKKKKHNTLDSNPFD